jgi:hypothetical protein
MKFFKILKKRPILRRVCWTLFLCIAAILVLIQLSPIKKTRVWGITFAPQYMEEFGIPWKEGYNAMLDDLGVKHIRIPVYWSRVEVQQGRYEFQDYDYMIHRAEEENTKLILGVGRKLPRWPECFEAGWANNATKDEKKKYILEYIREVVERYKNSPALEVWQVENEPFLPFGVCELYEPEFLDSEVALVRELDPAHPVIVTDSGELSIWVRAAKRGDLFGTTMYRIIYSKRLGSITYPIPPSFFRLKKTLTEFIVGKKPMMVIELQAEPWAPAYVPHMTKEEQYKYFSPETFDSTIGYAERTGFDTYYLWGAEWWYWLKTKQNDPTIWNKFKGLIQEMP